MDQSDKIFENDGSHLPLIDEFYSIQGEGYHVGKPAYFIRVGGCDIGCHWCDTKTSWNSGYNKLADVKDIVDKALLYKARDIVITGGEPSIYNLDLLCNELKKNNFRTYIETSGNHKITGIWDWICLSPKKDFPPLEENYYRADELKVIIFEKEDIDWAEEASRNVGENCKLFLQPEWSNFKTITPYLVEYAKNNTKWNISIQAHKFMKIP